MIPPSYLFKTVYDDAWLTDHSKPEQSPKPDTGGGGGLHIPASGLITATGRMLARVFLPARHSPTGAVALKPQSKALRHINALK